MSKKDKEIFESYASGNPKQRFELIYKNYRIFPKMIDSFETGVFNTILNEREYNRRAKNKAELGEGGHDHVQKRRKGVQT